MDSKGGQEMNTNDTAELLTDLVTLARLSGNPDAPGVSDVRAWRDEAAEASDMDLVEQIDAVGVDTLQAALDERAGS